MSTVEKRFSSDMPEVKQVESLQYADLEKSPTASGGDYSGAVKKTDPKEIALVRKLDFRIMPILWAMYFMNYVNMSLYSISSPFPLSCPLSSYLVPLPLSRNSMQTSPFKQHQPFEQHLLMRR